MAGGLRAVNLGLTQIAPNGFFYILTIHREINFKLPGAVCKPIGVVIRQAALPKIGG